EEEQRNQQDPHEHGHPGDTKPAQTLEDDCPWIDEDGFDVEDDEEHGGEVKTDSEATPGGGPGNDAGFIGERLRSGGPSAGQPGWKAEGNECRNEDRRERREQ